MSQTSDFLDTTALEAELHGRTVRSGLFAVSGRAAQVLILLGSVIVLARLLRPGDFGLIAMVLPVTLLANTTLSLGLPLAVVHDRGLSSDELSRLYWIAQRTNVIVAGLMALLAPALAIFYDEPRVTGVALIWAASLLIRHSGAFHEALLKRQLRFGMLTGLDLAGLVLGSATAISAAAMGAGHFSLILQIAVWETTRSAGAWAVCSWRPGGPGRDSAAKATEIRRPLAYGRQLVGYRLLYWAGRHLDRAVVGYIGGAASLGLYDISRRWAWYPFFQLFQALSEVAVSALSRLREDAERFKAYCRKGMLPIVALPLPAIALIFLEPEAFILTLLGEQWSAAAPFVRLMACAAYFGSLGRVTEWLFLSEGRTDRQLRWAFVSTPAMIGAVLVGARWGPEGVAWGFALGNALLAVPAIVFCLRESVLTARDFAGIVWRPVVASLLAGIAFRATSGLWTHPASPILSLLTMATIYLVMYAVLWVGLPGGRRATRVVFEAVIGPFRGGAPSPSIPGNSTD